MRACRVIRDKLLILIVLNDEIHASLFLHEHVGIQLTFSHLGASGLSKLLDVFKIPLEGRFDKFSAIVIERYDDSHSQYCRGCMFTNEFRSGWITYTGCLSLGKHFHAPLSIRSDLYKSVFAGQSFRAVTIPTVSPKNTPEYTGTSRSSLSLWTASNWF